MTMHMMMSTQPPQLNEISNTTPSFIPISLLSSEKKDDKSSTSTQNNKLVDSSTRLPSRNLTLKEDVSALNTVPPNPPPPPPLEETPRASNRNDFVLATLKAATEINKQTTTSTPLGDSKSSLSLDLNDLLEGDDEDDDDTSKGSIQKFMDMPSLVCFGLGDSFVSCSSQGGHSSLSSSADLTIGGTVGSTSNHPKNSSSNNTPKPRTKTSGGSILSSKCHSYKPDVMPRRESRWQTEEQVNQNTNNIKKPSRC
jgi:hypothetical protein